jgi:hypothetical protein
MGIGTRRMTEQAWDAALGAPGAALTLDEYRAAKLSHVHWWLERVAVALGCHPTEKGLGNLEQIKHLLEAETGIDRAVGRRVIQTVVRAERAIAEAERGAEAPSVEPTAARVRMLRSQEGRG